MSIPLYLLTYNCGKLALNAGDFAEKIGASLPDEICDLYVFGFQELCTIIDGAFPNAVNKHLIDINRIVLDTLKAKYASQTCTYNFTTVGLHHVGAIGAVAVTPFGLRFRDCRYADASCGAASSLLKGAVGFRVKYSTDSRLFVELTFACAHLSAFEGEVHYLRRIADIQTIMRGLDFGDSHSFLRPNTHAFFLGDLNFRTAKTFNSKRPNAALNDIVELERNETDKDTHLEELVVKHDELTHGKHNGDLFTGFDEGCITFRPTYKYHINTAIYNTKRCPLWCDRILFQNTYRHGQVEIHKYDSIASYMRSDHRPVYLHVTVPFEPPESIIGSNGYLMVLPSARPSRHAVHGLDAFPESRDAVSGPTQIYMRCTVLDKVQQLLVRRASDFCIGYGLWLGTTSQGRVLLLVLLLVLWLLYSMSGSL